MSKNKAAGFFQNFNVTRTDEELNDDIPSPSLGEDENEDLNLEEDEDKSLEDELNKIPYADEDEEDKPESKEAKKSSKEKPGGTEKTKGKGKETSESDEEKPKGKSKPVEKEPEEEPEDEDKVTFKPFLAALSDHGAIEVEDLEALDDSEDGVLQAINLTVQKRVEAELGSLSPAAKRLIEIEKKGGDIREAFETLMGFDYADVDIDDAENQTELIKQYYQNILGWEDEDIKEKLEQLDDAGETAKTKEAKLAQKQLVKHQEKEKAEYEKKIEESAKLREQEAKDRLNSLKKTIEETSELGGFKLDSKAQKALFEHITKPVDKKTGETQMMKNRKDVKRQLLAAYLDMLDYNLEDVEKKLKSKVTKGLKAAIDKASDISTFLLNLNKSFRRR